MNTIKTGHNLDLALKPDFNQSMERIYAWYEGEIIDRPPVRFFAHNQSNDLQRDFSKWKDLEAYWFDETYQIESFIKQAKESSYLGETFPVFWPNLGPNVYAALFGASIEFGEDTSWTHKLIENYDNLAQLKVNFDSRYFKKLESMTRSALEVCQGQFMVGYTDFHPGLDCADALRGTVELCMDMYDSPDQVKQLTQLINKDFQKVYDYFDTILKQHNQLSVAWMNIPSFGKLHIPSCDLSAMISNDSFKTFNMEVLEKEIAPMDHNIFHLDGKGVANHIDDILSLDKIDAIQWVQGVGDDRPIMQWLPLIKKIQASGKGVIVDLQPSELESFIDATDPEGIYLCVQSYDVEEQKKILKRIEKW